MTKRTALSLAVGFLGGAVWILHGFGGDAEPRPVDVAEVGQPSGPSGGAPVEASSEPELEIPHAVRVQVDVVDAETGTILSSRRDTSGEAVIARVEPAHREPLKLDPEIEVPPGYVSWDPRPESVLVARYATTVRFVHPLRRELVLRGRVEEFDVSVPKSARLKGVEVADRPARAPTAEIGSDGRFVAHGVPFLRGEVVSLTMEVDDSLEPGNGGTSAARRARWLGFCPAGWATPLEARLRFPRPEPASTVHEPPPGVDVRSRRCIRCCCGYPSVTPGTTWFVRVSGRLRGGRPAAGANVVFRAVSTGRCAGETTSLTLDERGEATTPPIMVGTYRVQFEEPGVVSSPTELHVTDDGPTRFALFERKGGEIDVDVVDFRGRTLPFASLEVSPKWIDVEDGVQRVDSFTDHLGHRALRHVDPGPVTIRATWGSRSKSVTVEAVEGKFTPARIALD